jgi:opacity protein-like surface antigen
VAIPLDLGFADAPPCASCVSPADEPRSNREVEVKRVFCLAALAAVLCTAAPARAQVFGQYVPADILAVNGRMGGVYADFSSNTSGLTGQLRLSFYPNVDFGFQGGIVRYDAGDDTKSALRLGADVRFGLRRADAQFPVDLSVGGGLGVISGDNYNILQLGPSLVASRAFPLSSGSAIVPFAGAMLSFSNVDIGDASETDFAVPLRLGAEMRAMPGLRVVAEMDLRLAADYEDHSAFLLGVNMPF